MAEFSLAISRSSTFPGFQQGSFSGAFGVESKSFELEFGVSPSSFETWRESSVEIGIGVPLKLDLGAYLGTTLNLNHQFFGLTAGRTFLENDQTSLGFEISGDWGYLKPHEDNKYCKESGGIFGNDQTIGHCETRFQGGRFGLSDYNEGLNIGATFLLVLEHDLPNQNLSLAGSLGVSVSPSSEPESFAEAEIGWSF